MWPFDVNLLSTYMSPLRTLQQSKTPYQKSTKLAHSGPCNISLKHSLDLTHKCGQLPPSLIMLVHPDKGSKSNNDFRYRLAFFFFLWKRSCKESSILICFFRVCGGNVPLYPLVPCHQFRLLNSDYLLIIRNGCFFVFFFVTRSYSIAT